MIRQAHTYLVGALSGVVVIGIAIAAFVVLVSAQVFHDLPIPALTSSDQKAAGVSQGKALNGAAAHRAVATTGASGTAQPNHTAANLNAAGAGQDGGHNAPPPAHHQASPTVPTEEAAPPAEAVETAPSTGTSDQGSESSGGNSGASREPHRTAKPTGQISTPTANSGGGGNPTTSSGTSGGDGGSNSTSPSTPSGTSSPPATGTGTAPPTTTTPPAPVTTGKVSEELTEGVNGVVGSVDEALGGALSETGVSKVTEEVVGGVVGPESVVGKTVDGVGEVVGGLVNGSAE